MNSLLRLAAFIIGFLGSLTILAAGHMAMPGFWLPAGFVGLMVPLVLTQLGPGLGRSALPLTLSGAVTFLGLWVLSARKSSSSFLPEFTYSLSTGLPTMGAILFIVALIQTPQRNRRAFFQLALTMGFACIVAWASSDKGGADPMIRWYENRFEMNPGDAELLTLITRKLIHFSFYGSVTIFAFVAARRLRAPSPVAFAVGLALLLAAFDEIRQASYPNRTGSAWDVLLDLAGASAFLLIANRLTREDRVR